MNDADALSVRVVVPTLGSRSRLAYLEQTFASIAAQDHPELEVVVVGPASSREAQACADRYGFRWIDEAGRSLSAAINQGWADAETDVLAWLGDDDLLAPGAVERACEALVRKPRAPMVYGRCQYIDADGAEIFVARPGRFAVWFSRFGQDVIPQPGSFQRASAVRDVGGIDPSLKYAMDLDLFLKLRMCGPFAYVRQVQGSFRLHPESLTMSNDNPGEEAAAVRARYFGPLGRLLLPVHRPLFRIASRLWAAAQWRNLL